MALHAIRSSWTLFGLISAFFYLGIAYFLLCISTAVYFVVRFASVFGLCFPCLCCSLLGCRNSSNSCFLKMLVEIPLRKIDSVHKLVRSGLAFSSTGFEDQGGNLAVDQVENRKSEVGFHGLDREACCGCSSCSKARDLGDREGGVDVKEKAHGNQKLKSGVRRRRRGALKYAKFMSVTSSNSTRLTASGVNSCPDDHNNKARSEIGESLDAVSGIEGGFQYDGKVTTESMVDERTWDSIELSGSIGGSNILYMGSSSLENSDNNENINLDKNEADRIRTLELALEREKAACTALYVELEKERAAAATAADEAIAMILRLQKEKAALEMEVRQDQRITEEQLAYDEEEMNLLKEILIRKERENYFLENEVKAYKQMLLSVDINMPNQFHDVGDKRVARSSSFHPDGGSGLLTSASVVENSGMLLSNKIAKGATSFGNERLLDSQLSCVLAQEGEKTHPNKSMDPSTSLAEMQIPDITSEINQSVVLQCQGVIVDQPCIGTTKCFSCEGESKEKFSKLGSKDSCDLHDSVHDKLPVHDVYVVDDNTEPRNKGKKDQNTSATVGSFAQHVDSCVLPDSPESLSSDITEDFTCRGKEEIEQNRPKSNMDGRGRIEPTHSGSSSLFDVNSERLKLGMEVEWLREMLRMVQEGKQQIKLSGDSRGKWKSQLKLPEDVSQELHEMQQLHEPLQHEPLRHASLPTVSSKVNLGKRHCKSMTWKSYASD